jgi:hypothetical protein
MTKTIFKKYVILLLIYIIVIRVTGQFGLRLYFTFADDPSLTIGSAQAFQSIVTAIQLVMGLIIIVMMIIDSRSKELPDWVIIVITLFTAETGILLFIMRGMHRSSLYEKEINHT